MGPILVATDFTAAGSKAMHYAAAIAERLRSSLIVVNVYNFPMVPTTEPSVALMPYEEFRELSKEGLQKAEMELKTLFPNLQIETRSTIGEVVEQLNEEAEKCQPLLIVVGSRERKHQNAWLGNTTASILNDLSFPVLAIPEGAETRLPKNAILATDLTPVPSSVVEHIREIKRALDLDLHLVHVATKESEETAENIPESLSALSADFKTVINNDLSEGIESYTNQFGADLVITLPHSHSWLESLFVKKHTKDLVSHLHLPLLCIPERHEA
jgi:nucleotide-binding universal stress UspA family protein